MQGSAALDWDDLRFVLAVARDAGLTGAARSLGVNQSTVFRRLNSLEEKLGVRLFERLPGGYRPTDTGARVVAAAGSRPSTWWKFDAALRWPWVRPPWVGV